MHDTSSVRRAVGTIAVPRAMPVREVLLAAACPIALAVFGVVIVR